MPSLVGPGRNLIPVNSAEFNRAHGIRDVADSLATEPDRMQMFNIETGDSIDAQFNPAELKEKVAANYSRLPILGLSHKPLQYQGTDNMTFDFELATRVFARGVNAREEVLRRRNFLFSLCYSQRGSSTVLGGAPPRVLFVWPELVSMRVRVLWVEGTHSLFGRSGGAKHSAYKVALESVEEVRIYSEDVLAAGTQRAQLGDPDPEGTGAL